jgi:hypothetical protein
MKELDPGHPWTGTLAATRLLSSDAGKVLAQSKLFLTELGAPIFEQPFAIVDSRVNFLGRQINQLTLREHEVLRLLVQQAPKTVNLDSLAELIFDHDEQYSLYTIAKVIERLRKKLDAQGISSSYLTTARNQGYFLKN